MKLQNLTVIFIIIIIPIILLVSLYITTGLRTIKYQSMYDEGLLNATHDAIYAFELNTAKNEYSSNPETKRNILKSSIKMFERSLANTCNISTYNTDAIEEYIPAIVFGMHDGFYMYAPSYLEATGKYEHNLKNYVYYSETLDDGTVIKYSLDNYISVSGDFGYKEGYLIDLNGSNAEGTQYKGITINSETIDEEQNTDGINYYKEAYEFTYWFLNVAEIQKKEKNGAQASYLDISDTNDPEDENSLFVQYKREIIKKKIESVLNSSITAYSERTWGQNYKMPKLSEEDWQKIYSNISMITFFQGKSIGLTKYNGYCVLNSTNSNEYVNPNLMYFIDESGYYHDIRCEKKGEQLAGYKIGDFEKKKVEKETTYEYKHEELACYYCINGQLNIPNTVQEYIYIEDKNSEVKIAYWTSLGRERYNQIKLLDVKSEDIQIPDVKPEDIQIPEGGEYIAASGTTFNPGDPFPETSEEGDIYYYDDYKYVYSHGIEGWSVSVIDKSKNEYGEILESINNKPITDMCETFAYCESLTTAPDIPSGVKNISWTFHGCDSLTTAPDIPNSVIYMEYAFCFCSSLTTAPEIPSSVIEMICTFYGCDSLTTAPEIPSSVTDMSSTFARCTKLEGEITINANPSEHEECFENVDMSEITLKGTSTILDAIGATGLNYNQ